MKKEWAFLPDSKYDKEKTIKLNNSRDRAKLMNDIGKDEDGYVLKSLDDGTVKNVSSNPIRKVNQSFQKSVPECLRYVGYAALCDVLKDCTQMKYSDVGTPEANKTYKKVDAIIKALSLEGTIEAGVKHGGDKKDAFLDALKNWKERYEQMRDKLNNNKLEEYVVNNERPGMNLDTNNRNRGRNENCGPFTSI